MRKIIYIIFIFILILSCNKNTEQENLIGSWQKTNVNYPNFKYYSQRTTFTDDSLIFEEFQKEKNVTRLSSKYKFDAKSKVISYNTGNNTMELEVVKLNESELELLNKCQKKTIKYKRVQ